MFAYHATPERNLLAIMREGLRPDADGKGATNLTGVYLTEDAGAARALVEMLYLEPVVVLAVDLTGLPVTDGDDDDDLRVCAGVGPDRITVTAL